MAKTPAQMTLPVLVRMPDGKDVEVGTITLDVKCTPSGRVKPPSSSDLRSAVRKVGR